MSAKLNNPIHWTASLKFFSTEEINTLEPRLPGSSRQQKHAIMHTLLTDPDIGLAHYATADYGLDALNRQTAALHQRGASGEKLSPEDWSQTYLGTENAVAKVRQCAKKAGKHSQAAYANGVAENVALTLSYVAYRSNENPVIINDLLKMLVKLAGLEGVQQKRHPKARKDYVTHALKRIIFESAAAAPSEATPVSQAA